MNKIITLLILINLAVTGTGMYLVSHKSVPPEPIKPVAKIIEEPKIELPIKNNIANVHPSYLTYEQTVAQLKTWNQEAPEMTEVKVYGKSTKGKDLYYLKISNQRLKTERPRILITACTHGNEPLASSLAMWYTGTLLKSYNENPKITSLLNEVEIYVVPIVSPDSYPDNRLVDGVDPNRDFPSPNKPNHKSVAPIAALQKLFLEIKPKAVLATHTWGRVFLTPYGDTLEKCPDYAEYQRIVSKMSELSGYKFFPTCELYRTNGSLNVRPVDQIVFAPLPIYGTEIDWYYRNGSMSLTLEVGTHQKIPSDKDIEIEFNRTFSAILHFLTESPKVVLKFSGL